MSISEFWRSVFPPHPNPTMRALSHGGGVQTWTLHLMSERGEIDRLDASIMGNPGGDRKVTMDYWEEASRTCTIPLYMMQAKGGDIYDHIRRSKLPPDGRRVITLPYFLEDGGQMMRSCTGSLKIDPVTQGLRQILGVKPRHRVPAGTMVEVWIGISTDEKQRAGGFPAEKWQHIRYPLLELDMSYADCVRWLEERQYKVPPRSRCVICPYRSNESWRSLDADEFELACQVDESLRVGGPPHGFNSLPYLHPERIPLRDVDLSRAGDLFEDDCMGACGT